ncbi:MAG: hypothetical protein IBJ03_15725 [Gemmatimonadaceae bacterium]|nr:hypothetical protein [Gemmatimonadaceae bacterium]
MSADATVDIRRVLVPVWIVTAVWDGICASLLSILAYGTSFSALWRGVASALPGGATFEGNTGVVVGLALHVAVALTWSAVFVMALVFVPRLRNAVRTSGGALAIATAYGPLIWLAMSLVVIPLATGRPPRIGGARWWVQIVAHIPFVTLPLVFTARRMLERLDRSGS